MKPGGIIVTMNQAVDQAKLDELGIRGRFNRTPTNTRILTELAQLNEEGHTRGKLAIQVR